MASRCGRTTCTVMAALVVAACSADRDRNRLNGPTRQVAPPPSPSNPDPVGPPLWPKPIVVGQEVRQHLQPAGTTLCVRGGGGAFKVPCHSYVLTSAAAGLLTARLTWDSSSWGTVLLLKVGDAEFAGSPTPLHGIVGRRQVAAGESVEIAVLVGFDPAAPEEGPYVLVTELEPSVTGP